MFKPSLICLSEPQLFQCDVKSALEPIQGEYCFFLNSEDLHSPELPLENMRAKGGTMLLWEISLDPYITILPSTTSSILPMLFKPPNHTMSCHIVIYLPTSGQESEFVAAMASLDSCICDIYLKYENCPIFIRGDANVNQNNFSRASLFRHFLEKYEFVNLDIKHPTYHHFLGDGAWDSNLDVILYQSTQPVNEELLSIVCKMSNPLLSSHHDMILTSCYLPPKVNEASENAVTAPKVKNTRTKIYWDPIGIAAYNDLVAEPLSRLRDTWGNPDSASSMSILLACTYSVLSDAAVATNHSIELGEERKLKSRHHPKVRQAEKLLLTCNKNFAKLSSSSYSTPATLLPAREALIQARAGYRHAIRQEQILNERERDLHLSSILTSSQSSSVFRSLKRYKSATTSSVHRLLVNDKTYLGEQVCDGFYDSLSNLKAPDLSVTHSTPEFRDTLFDYKNIIRICQDGAKIPEISAQKSTEILLSLRAEVNDFYSITASHFVNAGRAGFTHFHFLLSNLAKNVNLSSLDELNTVWACILYKGHGKEKESDRSYRTISTCPLLAKALDMYIGSLYSDGWQSVQAATQFQGSGSSHDLASLLLSETIEHSIHNAKLPVFVLLLDAKSAFDKVIRECAVRNAYLAGTADQGLLYIDSRLKNRKTYIEWNKVLMGPIDDTIGVEQGGVNSDKIYKLCNNVQLTVAQNSALGVSLGGDTVISSIGQADDTALVSNCLLKLAGLLRLTVEYCKKYHVELVPEKTKLLAFSPSGHRSTLHLEQILHPISLNNHQLTFSSHAEHVGVVRDIDGNMPHVMARISAHTRAMMSVLPSGMALRHSGNPAASLRVERLYGCPVLLSGLSSLILSKSELSVIHQHYKVSLQRLLKLHQSSPECVVMFLAGSLPATALVHLHMLGLLGMIARLGPKNILHQHGVQVLLSTRPVKSWFTLVRSLCQQYNLPDPLLILQSPSSKESWKSLTKSKVVDVWEAKLRGQANLLPSLKFFKPSYMSLTKPHPMWSCARSPYEVRKAVIVARMLSGRYRTDRLVRHWSATNKSGICQLPGCTGDDQGTLEHILLNCPALAEARSALIKLWADFLVPRRYLFPIISNLTSSEDSFAQLLLDPSTIPSVISANQVNPDILPCCFYLSRTWAYSVHLRRKKLLESLNQT